jgi:hypothetical protein
MWGICEKRNPLINARDVVLRLFQQEPVDRRWATSTGRDFENDSNGFEERAAGG